MTINEKDTARLMELFQQIHARQEHDGEYANYKDSPALMEMADLIRPYVAQMERSDADTLRDIKAVCQYLAENYQQMGRGVYASEFFTAAFCAAAKNGEEADVLRELFYNAVKTRNYYVDDACEDLKKIALQVLDAEGMEADFAQASKRTLRHDPVEMTPEYLAVIDEVEKKVDENMTFRGRGSCHERWRLTGEFLEEKGIAWRSQGAMNPSFRFD